MESRKWMVASLLAAGLIVASASAQARVYFDAQVGPPAERVEVVPAPRAGYVWAPGYYVYDGRRHVWNRGHWVRARPGHHWVSDRWEQRENRWHYHRGHWDRD